MQYKKPMRFLTPAIEPFQQDLESIHPALRLRVSTRAKRLALRLDPRSGDIILVMPKRASMKKALAFAHEYRDWINKHAANKPDITRLEDGVTITVLGQEKKICVTIDSLCKRTTIKMTDHQIIVHTNKDDPSGRILRFLKTIAKTEISKIALEKSTRIKRPLKNIQIRDTTSRWGSCSADGTLSFSWRLILAPPAAMDYVIAHEVAHLVHMNHKTRFWALCEKLSIDFKAGHRWMRTHGQSLMYIQ